MTIRTDPRPGPWKRALRFLVLSALLLVAVPARTDDSADDDVPVRDVFEIVGDLDRQKLLWRREWMKEDSEAKTPEAELVLKVATEPGLDRKLLKSQCDRAPVDRRKATVNNLDVGRHQLTKWLLAEAYHEANRRLAAEGLKPLERVTTVNSGGTGDYTRDVDVTVFAGDEARERVFFEAVRDLARKQGLTAETGANDSVKSGINIPEIEVAFHRGNNDLPDPRYATDVQQFHLDYRKSIEGQSRNPEAYFGYGFEMEVQGRRYLTFKPGQTLLQTYDMEGGRLKYRAQLASCTREVRSVLRGAVAQRFRRAQNCVHAVNDYLQAYRHELHAGGDPTKGALKYAGRAIESLCEYHGYRNWAELRLEDRIQLLATLFPKGYIDEPGSRERLAKLSSSIDVAYQTFQGKSIPQETGSWAGVENKDVPPDKVRFDKDGKPVRQLKEVKRPMEAHDVESHAGVALIFLRKASASMVGAVAQEMLDPPELSRQFLDTQMADDAKWHDMSPDERAAYAKQRDETFRQCVSAAAMENLLATVEQLRWLDLPDFDPKGLKPGSHALREMLETADPRLKPILQIAIDHADASVRMQNAKSPEERAAAQADMAKVRTRMEEHIRKPAPGAQIEAAAAAMGGAEYVRRRKDGTRPAGTEPPEETRKRMQKFVEDSMWEDEAVGFRAELRKLGVKGYLKKRMVEEATEIGNIADVLQLIEMYQNDASAGDYTWFATTNVLSRCYWGMGFLIQAGQVRNEEDLKALGKNVIFDACSRVIPGLAMARIIFEIERGLVMVTFGYMVNVVNADLIDALYTGEAGRIGEGMTGKVAGQIRDTGVCVLDGKHVIQGKDKKGVLRVVIDQPALYQALFTEWFGAGLRYDEIGARTPMAGEPGKLLQAHDRLARALMAVGTDKEPGWFGRPTKLPDQKELEDAAAAFTQAISAPCRKKTDAVLDTLAPRQFFVRQGDEVKDVIAEGLHQRLIADVMGGMVATWQTHRVEQMFARREVEYAAKLGDRAALAEAMTNVADTEMPNFDVELLGLDPKREIYASGPMPLKCRLRYDRPLPARLGNVKVEVEPLPPEVVEEARPDQVTRKLKQPVIFRMIANDGAGPVLGERRVEFVVRVSPSPDQIVRRACSLSLSVSGLVRRVHTGGWQPGTTESFSSIQVAWYSRDHATRMTWSGDSFVFDLDQEEGAGTPDSPLRKDKVRVTGTYDPLRNMVSFVADSTEVETRADDDSGSTRTITKHIEARDVPVGGVFDIAPPHPGGGPYEYNFDPSTSGYVNAGTPRPFAIHRISGRSTDREDSWHRNSDGETERRTEETTETILGSATEPNYISGASTFFAAPRTAFPAGAGSYAPR